MNAIQTVIRVQLLFTVSRNHGSFENHSTFNFEMFPDIQASGSKISGEAELMFGNN